MSLNPVGRPKSDPFALTPLGLNEPGQTGQEAQKAVAPAMKKVCPVCGSDNGPNEMRCANCSATLGGNQQMVDRSATPAGEQGNPLERAAQAMMTSVRSLEVPDSMNRRTKRDSVVEELSDEFVDSVDNEHLSQVRNSADQLGL